MQDNEKHFQLEILDVNKFVKMNEWEEIKNPIFFVRSGVPMSDGLLSNEIFGVSMDERSNIFGWIDLVEDFIHPLVYKKWCMMDRRIREIVHGTKKFIINSHGDFEENENGKNGVKWLKENFDKIKIKSTDSSKRDANIEFIKNNKEKIFINKMIVIPAYYRDVNSTSSGVGVGEINKMYSNLLISVRSLKETADYGLILSHSNSGRIQEIILQIYDWFSTEPNLSKKRGIIKRSVQSKTSDYAGRYVISAPNCRVEYVDNLMVDLQHTAVPLAGLCSNLFPFMIYWIRRWFENQFSGAAKFPVINNGKLVYETVKEPLEQFSDDRIKHELDRFMKGFSNRFVPIEIETEESKGKKTYYAFSGWNTIDPEDLTEDKLDKTPLIQRRMTWCDLIYMAAVELSKNKCVLITRYPIDSYYGQFPTYITVGSTKETEPMFYDNKKYEFYPKIRDEDIGTNTSNKFIDTLQMCNLHLKSIGGDYRPHHCSLRGKSLNKNYLNCSGKPLRTLLTTA